MSNTPEMDALVQKAMNGGLAAADLTAEMKGYQAKPRNASIDEQRSHIFHTDEELPLRDIVVSPNPDAEIVERPYGIVVPQKSASGNTVYDDPVFDQFRGKRCVNVGVDGREYVVGRFRTGLDRVSTYNFSQRRVGQWDLTPLELEQELQQHKAAGKPLTIKAEFVTVETMPYTVIDRFGKVSLDKNGNPTVTKKYSLIVRDGDDIFRRVAGAGYVINDARFGKADAAATTSATAAMNAVNTDAEAPEDAELPIAGSN